MRAAPPTEAELRATVDDLLASPQDDIPDGLGLDEGTRAAIERVWAAGPNPPDSLVAAARHEVGLQIDGTHAEEAQALADAIFDEVIAQHEGAADANGQDN